MHIFNKIWFLIETQYFQVIIRFEIIALIIILIKTWIDIQVFKLLLCLIVLLDQSFIILYHYFNIILFRFNEIRIILEWCMDFILKSLILWIIWLYKFIFISKQILIELPGPIYLKIFILIVVLIQKFLLEGNIIKNIFNIFNCLFIKFCLLFILHLRYSILYIHRNVLILIIGQKDIVLNCNILVFKSHDHIMKLQLDMLQY